MPLFSIVIPTRNRAHLLGYALQSALNQTFDDYEIVVSNNGSADETEQVVRQLADHRVRYFQTDKVLSMTDSWEFALSKARGEWITFLSDDDAISSYLLEKAAKVIARQRTTVVTWSHWGYGHLSHYHPGERNKLTTLPSTGKAITLNSHDMLVRWFTIKNLWECPRMLNSCIHRSVIEAIRGRAGRIFWDTCPDFSSCAAVLAFTESFIFMDTPLAIYGQAREHIRLLTVLSDNDSIIREFRSGEVNKHVPLRGLVMTNFIADSLLRVKYAMPERFTEIDLHWARYFSQYYYYLREASRLGRVDVSREKKEFFSVLHKQRLSVQLRAYLEMVVRTTCGPTLSWMRSFQNRVVRGEDGGFSNILEAVRYLDAYLQASVDVGGVPGVVEG